MNLLRFDDGADILFDAKVDHLIAVICENDINKIFANVMNIAFHGGNQEFGLR